MDFTPGVGAWSHGPRGGILTDCIADPTHQSPTVRDGSARAGSTSLTYRLAIVTTTLPPLPLWPGWRTS